MKTEQECRSLLSLIRWRDASLDRLVVDYESVTIELTESVGRAVRVKFFGHIALHWSSHWDENVVEKYSVTNDSESINSALRKVVETYGEHPETGGGIRNFEGPWYSFLVQLIDSMFVEVVAQDVEVEF